jgi:hypothetical protein
MIVREAPHFKVSAVCGVVRMGNALIALQQRGQLELTREQALSGMGVLEAAAALSKESPRVVMYRQAVQLAALLPLPVLHLLLLMVPRPLDLTTR